MFREFRWRDDTHCPRCGSKGLKEYGNYGQGLKRYRCKTCGRTLKQQDRNPIPLF
ncbi:MAG: IS1 family transposase [Candidatus Freyarchaeota archaeon]|nr:IS1 family transposase [Candidatus Jordarchaeia archaeon]MBS7280068.1 IS1 family transposase [Candidatus Jordarchaeia archaeon]